MSDQKRSITRKSTIIVAMMVSLFLLVALWGLHAYRDYTSCICFGVTSQMQTRAIDDRLRAWYEIDENADTFSLLLFTCPHNRHLGLKVYPADSTYEIWLSD